MTKYLTVPDGQVSYVASPDADGNLILVQCALVDTVPTQGEPGAQGAQGPQGPAGTGTGTGAQWFAGHGAPDNATGQNGDFYIDVDTGNIYEKMGGNW